MKITIQYPPAEDSRLAAAFRATFPEPEQKIEKGKKKCKETDAQFIQRRMKVWVNKVVTSYETKLVMERAMKKKPKPVGE